MDNDEQKDIIKLVHEGPIDTLHSMALGGHIGINKTYNIISKK